MPDHWVQKVKVSISIALNNSPIIGEKIGENYH
jgi:hypothetical protein